MGTVIEFTCMRHHMGSVQAAILSMWGSEMPHLGDGAVKLKLWNRKHLDLEAILLAMMRICRSPVFGLNGSAAEKGATKNWSAAVVDLQQKQVLMQDRV